LLPKGGQLAAMKEPKLLAGRIHVFFRGVTQEICVEMRGLVINRHIGGLRYNHRFLEILHSEGTGLKLHGQGAER